MGNTLHTLSMRTKGATVWSAPSISGPTGARDKIPPRARGAEMLFDDGGAEGRSWALEPAMSMPLLNLAGLCFPVWVWASPREASGHGITTACVVLGVRRAAQQSTWLAVVAWRLLLQPDEETSLACAVLIV